MKEACFNEEILYWTYGPVIKEAYNEYKIYGRNNIDTYQTKIEEIRYDNTQNIIVRYEKEFDDNIIDDDMKKLINKVLDSYKDSEARELVIKTHKEFPWRSTSINNIIEKSKIKNYYENNKDKLLE